MDAHKSLENATQDLAAWALIADGDIIGRIVAKRGRTGRATAWVQVWGIHGVFSKGWADGCGYDKLTASIQDAAERWIKANKPAPDDCRLGANMMRRLAEIPNASWETTLRDIGVSAQYIV